MGAFGVYSTHSHPAEWFRGPCGYINPQKVKYNTINPFNFELSVPTLTL